MSNSHFVYVTYIAASPEKIWDALTDTETLKRFWFDCTVEIGPRVGEPFNAYYKGEHFDEGKVLVFDPPKQLSVSWQHLKIDEPASRCTWTLEPLGEVTRLSLTHEVFTEPSQLLEGVSLGWPVILSGLKSYLETGSSPFNDWGSPTRKEEYAQEPTIYVTYIKSTPEKVWEALTNGDVTKQFFFGRTIESDWQVSSPVRYYQEDGTLDVSGEILIADYPRLLSYTWRVESMPELKHLPDCRVSFEIEQLEGFVRLRAIEYHDTPIDPKYLEGGRKGWPIILNGLKTLLETGRPLPAFNMA